MQNTVNSGVLAITLDHDIVERLAGIAEHQLGAPWTVRLAEQTITPPGEADIGFEIDTPRKERLLNGMDEIAMTLRYKADLDTFRVCQRVREPWLWANG